MIRLLDRPGGRFLLGKLATRVVHRGGGDRVEVVYIDGLWTRRIGSNFLPDSVRFEYRYSDFDNWNRQVEIYAADTREYWLRHYQPKAGDIIVDVGAGRGEDTYTFSHAVGNTGRVIAIEAHPLSFAILRSFCRLNGLANVTPVHLALMHRRGSVRIAESESSWTENAVAEGSGASGITVRAETLDQVCREQGLKYIDFVKMNIEGAERFALLGMGSVLPRIRQVCVACHDFRSDKGDGEEFRTRNFVEELLAEHGFEVVSRASDPRDFVRDHVFGLRRGMSLRGYLARHPGHILE